MALEKTAANPAPETAVSDWQRLCGHAVLLCGGQQAFQSQARILQRLVKQYGAQDVERMLAGAQLLGWRDLKSLGSKEGLGRRWAVEAYWRNENARGKQGRLPESVKTILREMGNA